MESAFEGVLQRLEPSPNLFKIVKAMFKDTWDMRLAQASETAKVLKASIAQIEKQIEALLDHMVDSGSATIIVAYEKWISKLEREKVLTQERLATNGKPRLTLDESFEHVLALLSSPWSLWRNSDLIGWKTVLRLAFLEPLAY